MRALIALALICGAGVLTTFAQSPSPTPVVLQAITPVAPPATAPTSPVAQPAASALATLLQLKAGNEAILAKQKATLQRLEELEKAADQIKIYTKRN